MVQCKLCKKRFTVITNTHLQSRHKTTVKKYTSNFGYGGVGFASSVSDLSKDDPRYIKWRENLLKRPAPWNSGHTKETHLGVAKISKTFKKRKIDNFSEWRKKAKEQGLIMKEYPPLEKNNNLAFLIGMTLGDGHIHSFPRTEELRISLGTDKPKLWKYTVEILRDVFKKEPYARKVKNSECMIIGLHQKELSKRLEIPSGSRKDIINRLPKWIKEDDKFILSYLRGLYEAEGSFCVHKPTYTYKMLFANKNESLLNIVYNTLRNLGFHPHRTKYNIQISRKEEVYRFKDLIKFRKHN